MGLQIQSVGVLGARRLAEISVENDQHDDAGEGEQRDVQRDRAAPIGKQVDVGLDEGDGALTAGQGRAGDKGGLALEPRMLHARALPEHQQRLRLVQQEHQIVTEEVFIARHDRGDQPTGITDDGKASPLDQRCRNRTG